MDHNCRTRVYRAECENERNTVEMVALYLQLYAVRKLALPDFTLSRTLNARFSKTVSRWALRLGETHFVSHYVYVSSLDLTGTAFPSARVNRPRPLHNLCTLS